MRGLAVVRIDGNDQYLGPCGSPESHEKYARLIGEWRQRQERPESSSSEATTTSFTVAELTLAYWTKPLRVLRVEFSWGQTGGQVLLARPVCGDPQPGRSRRVVPDGVAGLEAIGDLVSGVAARLAG